MTTPGLRLWLSLGAVAIVVSGCLYLQSLRLRLGAAEEAARVVREDLRSRDAVIGQLLASAREREAQYAKLNRTRSAVGSTLAAYQAQLRRLVHENEAVRAWASVPLPSDVVRLHGAAPLPADNSPPVRDGNSLPATDVDTADQR